jgi:hypothetical protein
MHEKYDVSKSSGTAVTHTLLSLLLLLLLLLPLLFWC